MTSRLTETAEQPLSLVDAGVAANVSARTILGWQRRGLVTPRIDEQGCPVFLRTDVALLRQLAEERANRGRPLGRQRARDARVQHDLDAAVTAVLHEALALFGTRYGAVYLYHPGPQLLYLTHASARSRANLGRVVAVGEGVAGQAAAQGPGNREPFVVRDYEAFARAANWPVRAEVSTVIALPLYHENELVGVLDVVNAANSRITDERVERLVALAPRASVAARNASEFARVRKRALALSALGRLSASVYQLRDALAIVRVALEELVATFASPGVALYLNEGSGLQLFAVAGADTEGKNSEPTVAVRAAFQRATALFIPPARHHHPNEASPNANGEICVPVGVQGETLGVLQIWSGSQLLGADDVSLAELFATGVGAALANARAHALTARLARGQEEKIAHRTAELERVVRRLEIAARVSRELAEELSEDELIAGVPVRVGELLGYSKVGLLIVDETTEELVLYGARPAPDAALPVIHRQGKNQGLCGWVAANLQPLYIPDVREDLRYIPDRQVPDVRSELDLPVRARGALLGVLSVVSQEVNAFTDSDRLVLGVVADQLGVALSNARLHAGERKRERDTALLARAGQLFNGTLELDDVLAGVTELMAHAVGDGCAISLFDGDSGPLQLRALACRPDVADATEFRARLVAESRVLGHRLHEVRPLIERSVLIPDTESARDLPSNVKRLGVRSLLQTPLSAHDGKILGTLLNWVVTPGRHYDERDRALATQLAEQAVLAIENARLYESARRQRREELTFSTLAQDVAASLDQRTVLQRITRHAQYLLNADMAVIVLYDPARDLLVASALTGFIEAREGNVFMEPDQGVAGLVWQSWQPVTVEDYFKDERIDRSPRIDNVAAGSELTSLLAVPIALADERLGVLQVGSRQRRVFSAHDRQLLLRASTQAALAVRNSRLYEEANRARILAERRANTLEGLLETSRAIASRRDLDTLLDTVMDRVLALIPAESGGLYFVEDGYLRPATMRADYLRQADFSTFTIDRGIGGWIARHAEPVLCHDAPNDPRYFAPPGASAADQSLLGAPLIADGEVVGVLMLGSLRRDHFDESDLALLVAFAGQAAIAIKNARLFAAAESRARRLAMLNETGRALSSVLDLQEVFATIHEQTRRVLSTDAFFVALYDDARGVLTFPYIYDEGVAATREEPMPLNNGPTSFVVRSKQPLFLLDPPEGNRPATMPGRTFGNAARTSVSRVYVPLLAGDRVVGAMSVQSYTYGAYDEEDVLALQTVASQAVKALENARSYERARERSERLQAVNEIVKAIGSTPDLHAVVRLVAARARRIIPAELTDVLHVHPDGEITPWSHQEPGGGTMAPWMHDVLREVVSQATTASEPAVFGDEELSRRVDGDEDRFLDGRMVRTLAVAPVRDDGRVVALIRANILSAQPFNDSHREALRELADHLGIAIQNTRLAEQSRALYLAGVKSLAAMVDAKDRYTHGHSERVAGYARMIALGLALPPEEIEAIELAGLMHDIGKIGIPDSILQKPGKLDPDEMQVMMTHAAAGADILASNESLAPLAPYVRSHHERWDGGGYPDRLEGAEIPLGASIISVADTFDTMTSDRPYRKAPGLEAARSELARCAGAQFRPEVVSTFFQLLGGESQGTQVQALLNHAAHEHAPAGQITPVETRGLRILNQLAAEIHGITDLDRFLMRVLEIVIKEVQYEHCDILLLDDAREHLVVRASVPPGIASIGLALPPGRGLSRWVLEHGVTLNVPDVTHDARFFSFDGQWRSNLIVPLLVEGQAIGVINLEDERVAAFTQADEQLWSTIAGQLAQAIEVARLHDALKRLATTDGLTGVANHRHFYDRLEEELARSRRSGSMVGLVVLDVDSLKSVNDTHGHLVGDALLRAVATTLAEITRREDVVARYGGDEFTVILSDTHEADIAAFEARLVAAFSALRVVSENVSIAPIVSIGSARFPDDGDRAKTLILVADRRLYDGRRERRAGGTPTLPEVATG